MFDWGSGKSTYTNALYPDDTPAIDFVLDESVVRKIYLSWIESVHGNLADYGGGVRAITVRMLLEAGEEFLLGVKGIGVVRATDIISQMRTVLQESPYGSGL